MLKALIVLRAYAWPASVVPVIAGSVLASRAGSFSWLDFALTLAAALSVHSGANLANTYYDFRNGVDSADFADDRALVDGMIVPRTALLLSLALLTAGAAIGVLIAVKNRLPLLMMTGAAGFFLAWFYTAGTVRFKYRMLGDLGIFLAFGPLIVCGTELIQTGRFSAEALLVSVPLGLLIAAIVHANNMRDIASDHEAGVKTLAGALGLDRSKQFYRVLLICAYLLTLFCGGIWPPAFAALSLPLAIKLDALSSRGKFSGLVRETAKFVTVFGLLFSAGLLI